MPRIPQIPLGGIPPEILDTCTKFAGHDEFLDRIFKTLLTNRIVATEIARIKETIGELGLEPWVTYTIGLTVVGHYHDRKLWDSILPLAEQAGVKESVITSLKTGLGPRGLLPKDAIWVQFTKDMLSGSMKDTVWQAAVHLVGDSGVVGLAFTVCYFDMLVRMNQVFALNDE